MGLFGSFGSFFQTAAKAVATGGISLVAPRLIPRSVNTALNTITSAQFPTSLNSIARTGAGIATRNPSLLIPNTGANPMALDLGGLLGSVGSIFGGNQNPVFNGISNVANLASNFVPQPVAMRLPGAGTTAPMIRGISPGRAIVGRGFFNRYPNLATGIQGLRNMGRNVTRSQLYSMLKRFGPELMISGGILTAAAISELMQAGSGRKRMNPGNVKALRRSMRRVEAFHKICVRADTLRKPRRSKPCKTSGSQFVRQG